MSRMFLVCVTMLVLWGCAVPLLPIPLVPYAPSTTVLPEQEEQPLVQATLSSGTTHSRQVLLGVRSGSVRGLALRKTEAEFLSGLPSAKLKMELSSIYIPPYKYEPAKAGSKHYFNFTVTLEFEQGLLAFLSGKGEAALGYLDKVLADERGDPALLWQASYLRVLTLLMTGRPDLAEKETARTQRHELAATGKNHGSRALRAEARYWAGDLDGASEDAVQVIRALGDWRFPSTYAIPPIDQVELARVTAAQVRSDIVLGLALMAKARYREAIPWLELANQTMNNVMFVGRHPLYGLYFQPWEEVFWARGMSLATLGTALLATDVMSERSQIMFARAREFFDALGSRSGEVLIETFKTHALIAARRPDLAEAQAAKALVLAEKGGFFDYQWRLSALRGESLIVLGRWDEAEREFRRAQNVIDLLAGTLVFDDAKVQFGIGKEAVNAGLARINLRNGDMPRLFEDLERGRARAFVSLLANRMVATGRQEAITGRIRDLDREILEERRRKNAISNRDPVDAARERRLLEKRLALILDLRRRDPDLADVLAVSAVSLESAQSMLPPDTALVYALPGQGGDPLRLLVITRREVKLKDLPVTTGVLKKRLSNFNDAIPGRNADVQRSTLQDLSDALDPHSWGSFRSVYFVPSGDFHFIPWGALDLSFPVAVLPTGGWVARASIPPAATPRAVVVGDPAFGGILPPLPGAREEAIEVSRCYGASPLLGSQATEKELRRQVGRGVDVLHLASHALYDPFYPLLSALFLTDGKYASPLTAERLFEQPLSARMVVLSACETGMGQVIEGDEMLGLVRSFYLGGASAVLSTLWPVEDVATRSFMEVFHKKARSGDFGAAWIAARDALKAKGFPPSSYGAFVLAGSLGTAAHESNTGHMPPSLSPVRFKGILVHEEAGAADVQHHPYVRRIERYLK